ncbi:Hypothetical predicted protein [Lecanosticta acicola]|uniref:Uncharacterized protein n=1 Tax=Lecanosticta acicola TaxID=111012 RepID=A0AAI8Z681_9PEZI|nr:Hypothetical predicted protein [Lecanosticta acicola]
MNDPDFEDRTISDDEEDDAETVSQSTLNPDYTALKAFRRAWRNSTQARGGSIRATELLEKLDVDTFCVLEKMLNTVVLEESKTYIRHMDRSPFWKLCELDIWGLFGNTGCTAAFLLPLTRDLARECQTAEEAVGFLEQARERRRSRHRKGEVDDRETGEEWTPSDVKTAVELAKKSIQSITSHGDESLDKGSNLDDTSLDTTSTSDSSTLDRSGSRGKGGDEDRKAMVEQTLV